MGELTIGPVSKDRLGGGIGHLCCILLDRKNSMAGPPYMPGRGEHSLHWCQEEKKANLYHSLAEASCGLFDALTRVMHKSKSLTTAVEKGSR